VKIAGKNEKVAAANYQNINEKDDGEIIDVWLR